MTEANKKPSIVVTFNSHQELNPTESAVKGRPIFDDIEICEIRFPGDLKCWSVFPAHEAEPNATREAGHVITYAEFYNDQYKAFKNKEQQTVAGTPLSEAPFLTEGKRRELRALNIHSVEALAGLDGANLKMLGMGGREWKNQAQAYLDAAAGTADVTALAAKNADLQTQLDELRKQISGAGLTPAPNETPNTESPFATMEPVDIVNWIVAQGGKKPATNISLANLILKADELNAELAKKAAAAA